MADITLHIQPGFQVPGRPRCFSGTPFAIKVQRVLQYKRLPFTVREVGWHERGEVLPRISKSAKLPVLEYDEQLVEDSTVMAYLLEERHPHPPLVPTDPYARARMHFMEEWSDEVLYWYGIYGQLRLGTGAETVQAYFGSFPEEVKREVGQRFRDHLDKALYHQGFGRYPADKFWAELRRSLDGLATLVARDGFAAGGAFTLADIALFAQISRSMAGTHPWFEPEIHARPALGEWMDRVDQLTQPPGSD